MFTIYVYQLTSPHLAGTPVIGQEGLMREGANRVTEID